MRVRMSICAVATLFVASAVLHASGSVLTLTDRNFESEVARNSPIAVAFYGNDCDQCPSFDKKWHEVVLCLATPAVPQFSM